MVRSEKDCFHVFPIAIHVHQRVVFVSLKITPRLDRPAAYYVDPILKRTQLGYKLDLQLTWTNCGEKDAKASYESWSPIRNMIRQTKQRSAPAWPLALILE